ncbi:MAG: DoxX family protein [Gammaproteobacteria bacterium]|nr:DoxX family protein [Gammaproteobacteria bacterium]
MNKLLSFYQLFNNKIELMSPAFQFGIRIYLFDVFFSSGLTKIQSWETTKMLFAYEYNVPLLNPELAAWLGTAAELTLPIIILLGIFSRPTALALFAFNAVAALSYPDISPAGTVDHIMWGVMSAAIFFHGPGKISFDHLILNKLIDKKTNSLSLNNEAELAS